MQELKHLWYSEKCQAIKPKMPYYQKDMHGTHNKVQRHFYKREDGSIVEVSFVTDSPENITQWDDIQYLGVGTWHHNEYS